MLGRSVFTAELQAVCSCFEADAMAFEALFDTALHFSAHVMFHLASFRFVTGFIEDRCSADATRASTEDCQTLISLHATGISLAPPADRFMQ